MSGLLIHYCIIYLILGALLVARPWLSRKNVLLGVVFADNEIWQQRSARRVINRFVVACAAITIILTALFLVIARITAGNEATLSYIYIVLIFVLLALNLIPYIIANRSLRRLKATMPNGNLTKDRIAVELDDYQANPPIAVRWFLLLLIPIAITVLLAVITYPDLPQRVATHYSASGVADAWSARSIDLIVGPIFSQCIIAAIMFLIGYFTRSAPASVKGNPGAAPGYSRFRRLITLFIIVLGLIVESGLALTILTYAGIIGSAQTEAIIISVLIAIALIVLLLAFFRTQRSAIPSGAVLDDDNRWFLGKIYINPSDSALFVEKRNGIGSTFNFGHPVSWVIIAALVVFIIFRVLTR